MARMVGGKSIMEENGILSFNSNPKMSWNKDKVPKVR